MDHNGACVKSPSDTTIYVPALQKMYNSPLFKKFDMGGAIDRNNESDALEKISSIVENFKISAKDKDSVRDKRHGECSTAAARERNVDQTNRDELDDLHDA